MHLSSCPYRDSGLAIIDSELTTVGGRDGAGHRSNRLFTLRQGKWVEVYPPMNTARSSPAVVSTSDGDDYLIAIGGFGSDRVATATVELFHVKRRWYKLTDLPQPLPRPSATICVDQLHVIGRDGKGYSCSLQSLPSNDRPITSPLLETSPSSTSGALNSCHSLWTAQPQVLRAAQHGVRPGQPARPISARHPPRLVGKKRSPELGDGGKDRGLGRGSYRASYESCSHHDKGTWCLGLHASRGQCSS